MDVGAVSNIASQGAAQYAALNKNVASVKSDSISSDSQKNSLSSTVGAAYDVDISDAAKAAQQKAETDTVDDATTQTKGLSSDQVQALQDEIDANENAMLNLMIQALTDNNDKLQSWFDEGVGILNFDGVQIDASRFALPEVATNAEDAAKAVADGGDWSVDAVASRIFDLADAMAGGDPDKLAKMRSAVEEGFKQAGIVWKDKIGEDTMPEITQKTYDDVMSRFDKRAEELSASKTQTPTQVAAETTEA